MRRIRTTALGMLAACLLADCSGAPAPRTPPSAGTRELPEHYAQSVAALGFPGARRAIQVGDRGAVSGGECALEWGMAPGERFSVSPVWFERDGVPVAHWWMVSERESVAFEAAAIPIEAAGDTNLFVSIRAIASRRGGEAGDVSLAVRVREAPEGPHALPWDAPGPSGAPWSWRGRVVARRDRALAGLEAAARWSCAGASAADPGASAAAEGAGGDELVARVSAALPGGGRQAWDTWLAAYPVPFDLAGRLEPALRHEAVVGEARTRWRAWLARAAAMRTPDSLVNAAYRAALVTLIQDQERRGDDWLPVGNPFQYRDTWLRDGARAVHALAVAGLTDLARADAWALRRYQLPNGVILSQFGQLDGTGEAMWAFAQAAGLPPSPEWARRFLPCARAAGGWLETQRALTRSLALPWPGLLPYGEPRDDEAVRAQLVGNDAWGIAGLRALSALGVLAGDTATARAAGAAAQDYRGAFLAALARVPRTPRADVPPSWQGAGRDWGNLAVGYPTRVLPPDDPRLDALTRRLWERGAGLITYGDADSLHSYLGGDLALLALLAGRPGGARAVLAALLAHSSSTLGQAEVFAREGGAFHGNLPPHSTAAALVVDLVRTMIVCDARDTLELGLGGDRAWWGGTRFENAPTRFGLVSVELSQTAPDRLEARWTPVGVPTRIRVPDGVRAVSVEGGSARATGPAWLECPPRAGRVAFTVVRS